jgi:DNA invertase Pin-like site-specific DNA recombinase
MKYGYARVSPGGKSESVDAQARQLTKAGCKKVFRDLHVSGAKTDRAQLRRVIEALEPGDVLAISSILAILREWIASTFLGNLRASLSRNSSPLRFSMNEALHGQLLEFLPP